MLLYWRGEPVHDHEALCRDQGLEMALYRVEVYRPPGRRLIAGTGCVCDECECCGCECPPAEYEPDGTPGAWLQAEEFTAPFLPSRVSLGLPEVGRREILVKTWPVDPDGSTDWRTPGVKP